MKLLYSKHGEFLDVIYISALEECLVTGDKQQVAVKGRF